MTTPRQPADDELAAHVRRLVAAAPPLTPARRDRLIALLRPGTTDHDRTEQRRPGAA